MAFAQELGPDGLPHSPKESQHRLRFEAASVSLAPGASDFALIDSKPHSQQASDGLGDKRSGPDGGGGGAAAVAASSSGLPGSTALLSSGKNSESPKPREPPREALNREMYRIPSYAGWFSWGKFHAIERRALSEFFDGRSLSKSPKIYKEYRDFIINKFRENPRRVLTFTEVRKMLIGDVNSIRKVFDFLEYWGLINHHIAAETKQQTVATENSPATMSETVPRGIRIVYPGSTLGPRVVTSSVSVDKPVGVFQSSNLASHKDAFASSALDAPTAAVAEFPKPEKLSCSKCRADCTKRRFENSKKAEFMLCPSCFSTLKTGEGFSKDDFREKETNLDAQLSHENWTRQETLLLLEAVSKLGEDWNRVASHVGTRSKAECIIHFIKLPFGDQFLNNVGAEPPDMTITTQNMMDARDDGRVVEQRDSSIGVDLPDQKMYVAMHGSNENLESIEDAAGPPLKRKRLTPLADSSNPILAQVAFLSAMVGPRVAAAAAQAAVVALAEEDPLASQLVSSSNHSTQAGHKDPLPMTGIQATSSKENVKTEHGEKEDVALGKGEQMHLPKEAETEIGNAVPSKDPVPSVTQIRAGIATAIGAVAANAKLLADQEEREIEHLVASIIENQLKKLQSKVEHFEELEFLLEREHLQIEKARTQVLADWIRYSHYHYNTGPG